MKGKELGMQVSNFGWNINRNVFMNDKAVSSPKTTVSVIKSLLFSQYNIHNQRV